MKTHKLKNKFVFAKVNCSAKKFLLMPESTPGEKPKFLSRKQAPKGPRTSPTKPDPYEC